MKTRILTFLVAILFIACEENIEDNGPSIKTAFEVKNGTSKDIEISLYKPDNLLFISRNISAGDSSIMDEGFLHPAPNGPSYSLTNSLDSAVILFDDGKKLTQCFFNRGVKDTVNNVLSDRFYQSFEEQGRIRKQFILTEQDYQRAQ
ncbi:MAG: hypothetical protein ACYC1Q_01610 [Bacteroidia bacterium]